jgi:GT2 family glycosyltransferase
MTASPGPDQSPEVSVVIVNWNSRKLLDDALASFYERTRKVTFETIVVDNGSADGSAEHIRSAWPGVRLIALDADHGFGAANHIAFAECRGKYVLLLNPDTVVLDTIVSGLIECMEEHPEAGCVGERQLTPTDRCKRP